MRKVTSGAMALVLLAGVAWAQTEPGWRKVAATAGAPARLVYGFDGEPVTYVFACAPGGVRLMETAVTGLTDVHTNKAVAPGAPVPEDASLMALYADGAHMPLVHAETAVDPDGGWDLSIVVPLKDPVLQAVPGAKKIQLATTGWNSSADIEDADRPVIRAFLASCAAK